MAKKSQSVKGNIYNNIIIGATPNPVMPHPDAIDEEFAQQANEVLQIAADSARDLIGAHQSAIAIIVQKDWHTARKFFSLSSKYAGWKNYRVPAKGFGIHTLVLEHNEAIRLTQSELETHPAWKGFGREAGNHPPMRGWLAVPLIDRKGINWGLAQLSDKYEGEFTKEDEQKFVQFIKLISLSLETLWEVRNLKRKTAPLNTESV